MKNSLKDYPKLALWLEQHPAIKLGSIAKQCGYSPSQISDFKTGTKNFNSTHLMRICVALTGYGLSIDGWTFYAYEDDPLTIYAHNMNVKLDSESIDMGNHYLYRYDIQKTVLDIHDLASWMSEKAET